MPSVEEKPNSRSGVEGVSSVRVFSTMGYADAISAIAAVYAKLDAAGELVWEGLVARSAGHKVVSGTHGAYDVTVNYGQFEILQPRGTDETSYEWQTRLESARVTQSIATVSSYKLGGGTPEDHKQAIGVKTDPSGRKQIEGVDILTPVSSFTITIRPPNSAVDQAYRLLASKYVGCVNSQIFQGHDPGEVLFAGLGGGQRSESDHEIPMEFLVSENESMITAGGISGIDKDGWDYLWTDRRNVKNGATGEIESTVVAAYVEQVYRYKDLNDLLI